MRSAMVEALGVLGGHGDPHVIEHVRQLHEQSTDEHSKQATPCVETPPLRSRFR